MQTQREGETAAVKETEIVWDKGDSARERNGGHGGNRSQGKKQRQGEKRNSREKRSLKEKRVGKINRG